MKLLEAIPLEKMRLGIIASGSWFSLLVARFAAPSLTGFCLVLAWGASCMWLAHRFSADRVFCRIIFWSWFLKMAAAVSLFYISFWSLPILRSLQIGSGFWVVTRDPSFFDWFARWIIHCWQTNQPIPGRLFYDQAQQLYCAGVYLILGSHPLHVVFIGIGVSTVGVILAYDLIRRFGGSLRDCCVGAALIAFWPSAAVWSTQMIKEPLILFTIFLTFWCAAILLGPRQLIEIQDRDWLEKLWDMVGGWYGVGLSAAVFVMTLFRFYLGGVLALSVIAIFMATIITRWRNIKTIPRMFKVALIISVSTFFSLLVFYLKPEEGHPAWYQLQSPIAPLALPADEQSPLAASSFGQSKEAVLPDLPKKTFTAPVSATAQPSATTLSDQPKEKVLSRKSLAPLTTMMAVRNGYIRTGGASNKASHADQIYENWKALALLPRSLVAAFLEPYPCEWFQAGNDVKTFRRFVLLDMILIYLLLPGMLLAVFDWRAFAHPARLYLVIFSLGLAVVLGFSIINIGTLFRLRLQFLLPFIILWASSSLAMRRYADARVLLIRAVARVRAVLKQLELSAGLVGVGFFAALARVLFAVAGPEAQGLKRLEFSVMADHFNRGHGFIFEQYGAVYHAYKEPLYVMLLAWINRVSAGHDWGIFLLQGFFGVSAAVGTVVIARRILGIGGRAVLAGVIVAANPFLLFYDMRFVHPLSLDAFCFLLMAGSVLEAAENPRGGLSPAIKAGLIGGLVLWERAALIAAGLLSWCSAAVVAGVRNRRFIVRKTLIWLGLCLLVISPWILRNYCLLGRPVVTSDFAHIFWLGNNPHSNGTYSDMTGHRVFSLAAPQFQAHIRAASELEQSDLFLADSLRFIREKPARFFQLVLQRLWAFVWFSPNAGLIYSAEQGVLYRTAYGGLLAFGLIGLALFWRRSSASARKRVVIFGAAVAGVAFVHALTAINLKHRVPFELFLSVFAAEALAAGWNILSRRRQAAASKDEPLGRKIPELDDAISVGGRN